MAGEELRQTRVTAPIGGRALRREGRVGEVVVPGTLLFWIGSPRAQLIVAQIDEEYFPGSNLASARSSVPMPTPDAASPAA